MATGGNDAALTAKAKEFATKNGELTSKDMTRWFTDAGCFGKQCSSNNLDIAFSKHKPKGKTTLPADKASLVIKECGKAYAKDKKKADDEAICEICEKMGGATMKAHGTTGTSKTGGVSKMTDASKYTGAHKERFDESGKGKGAEGRTDKADNTGYVGAYKGKDTHGKK